MALERIELKPGAPSGATTLCPDEMDPEPTGPPADETPCEQVPLPARLEAVLLATGRPMSEARLAEVLGLPAKGAAKEIRAALDELNKRYEAGGHALCAQQVAGGWQLYTRPDLAPLLARVQKDHRDSRLSQPALETLAIIAYRQPIMRAEIEAIRGVASGEVLRALLERRLVKIVGRAEQLGRPMLYGTTTQFLKVFGLPGIEALPEVE